MSEFPLDKQSYELLHLIARTESAKVYVARCVINGRLVCAKLIDLELFKIDIEKLRRQISFWASSNNHNLIKYYGAFTSDSTLWILCEYMDGGSIFDIIQFAYTHGFKDEYLIASIMEQVVSFLVYWHSSKQIHRNIKPATILVSSDGSVKVGSLGCATTLIVNGQRKSSTSTVTGTICYTAPEVLTDEKKGYTEKADIWSLGITAIELATGKNPYTVNYDPIKDYLKLIEQIVKGQPPEIPTTSGFSPKFAEFVKMCLQTNPEKRASSKHLLKSAFIKQSKGKKYISSTLMSNMPLLYQRYEMNHPGEKIDESFKPWITAPVDFDFCGADAFPTPFITIPRIKTSSSSERLSQEASSPKSSSPSQPITFNLPDSTTQIAKSESGSIPEIIVSESSDEHESSTGSVNPPKRADTVRHVGRFTVTYKAQTCDSKKPFSRTKSDIAGLMKKSGLYQKDQSSGQCLKIFQPQATSLSPPTSKTPFEVTREKAKSAQTLDDILPIISHEV